MKSTAPQPDLVADHLKQLRGAVPPGFSVGYAGDWNSAEALLAGGDAWYCVAAGLFPNNCLAIVRAVQAGDAAEARRLNGGMQPLWDLFKEFSSLRADLCHRGSQGDQQSRTTTRPILPLPEAAKNRIAQALKELTLS